MENKMETGMIWTSRSGRIFGVWGWGSCTLSPKPYYYTAEQELAEQAAQRRAQIEKALQPGS